MRILVYGDSNSWGYLDDGLVQRYAERWPVVMAQHGKTAGWELIEECLSGRTTNLPDPEMGAYVDGSTPLLAILRSHRPFDLMLVMLGTNDLKTRFGRSADDIVGGLSALSDIVEESEVWEGPVKGRLGFIAPPALGARADDPSWDFSAEWLGGRSKSLELPSKIQAMCAARGHLFFDGNQGATSSELDPIHWDESNHHRMGKAVVEWLTTVL